MPEARVIGEPRKWAWHGDPPEPGDLFLTANGSVRMVTAYRAPLAERFQTDVYGRVRHRIEVVRVDPGSVNLDDCVFCTVCGPDGRDSRGSRTQRGMEEEGE